MHIDIIIIIININCEDVMRTVVKVGTSTLAYSTGNLNIRHMEKLCRVLSDLKNAGHEMILVSSGAVGMGMGRLSLSERPADLVSKQAVSAVGQCELMYTYDKLFSEYNHTIAQILLTADDVNDPDHRANFIATVNKLLEMNVLPVINENDSVSTEEFLIGDNDTLSAVVAANSGADLLILLTDIDGLYTGDPRENDGATLIPEVREITDEIKALAGGRGSHMGTGGMITKIRAAEIATAAGCDMIIANGKDPNILYDIIEGDYTGTKFVGKKDS